VENNSVEIKYTLCFIEKDDCYLMLNRIKSPNMGLWNGVGGKLEPFEDKFHGIKREITEETGLSIKEVKYHGDVYWYSGDFIGGMHVFTAKMPLVDNFQIPREDIEGLLSFKKKEWLFHKDNRGVISNIPIFLEKMVNTEDLLRFDFYYDKNEKIEKYTLEKLNI